MLANDSEKLKKFVSNLAGDRFFKIEKDLGAGFFRLNIGESEKRQARHDIKSVEDCVIEMIRNSRDAGSTRIFIATSKSNDGRRSIRFIDDGRGIPDHVRDAVFEPRVTSKLDNLIEDRYGIHGRGMALFSIRSSPAVIELAESGTGLGSVFSLDVCTEQLGERNDQSTFPVIKKNGQDISGPRNVPRLLVEFALDHPNLALFLGSPAEVLATMIKEAEGFFSNSLWSADKIPFWLRPASARDAGDLVRMSRDYFYIEISERNAHRIFAKEIEPIKAIDPVNFIRHDDYLKSKNNLDIYADNRHMTRNISKVDLETFTKEIQENFRSLGEKYFIKIEGEPEVKRSRRKITISIPVAQDQEDILR